MKIYLHQTHHTIADFPSIFGHLYDQIQKNQKGLHLFSECYLNGYPAQDLYLRPSYIHRYHLELKKLNDFCAQQKENKNTLFLVGGLEYQWEKKMKVPRSIFDCIYHISLGAPLKVVYRKQLLPSYDIFDEAKYFTPGAENTTLDFQGKKLGLLICEDMWATSSHTLDPVLQWQQAKEKLDLIINLGASPFHLEKANIRFHRASAVSHLLKAPLVYVNRVGGEDGILFDGGSFVINGNEVLAHCPSFQQEQCALDIPPYSSKKEGLDAPPSNRTPSSVWSPLFKGHLNEKNPLKLHSWSKEQWDLAIPAIQFGLQEYAEKNGFQKFLVALSGGIDSAIVLTLIKLGLRPGQELEALYMPGLFSSPVSGELSRELCQNLHVPCKTIPIKFIHATCRNAFLSSIGAPLEGRSDENIQSRLRGALLYTRSNQTGAMVVNTSNKSELSVGYCTQYGDAIGALAPIGDLYKSEVYELANHLNQHYGALIPQEIIQRPPSAELKEGQKDSDSLPDYSILDPILEGLLSHSMAPEELVLLGHDHQMVEKILKLHALSEFKRAQFCPIIKIKVKSYGFGHRVPISKYF